MAHRTFKDHFSQHSADYARFRPRYSDELFRYLADIAPGLTIAWDCATGNGQAAVALADRFKHVVATDASVEQIANATRHPRIEYRVAPAEASGLDSDGVDLVTIAQALHWFDLDRFYQEAKRVLKERGVIAAWAYNLLQIAPPIDAVVNDYYDNVVGAFWPPERAQVERFDELPFPFTEIVAPSFDMAAQWNVEDLLGYLKTWSATRRFIAANNSNPLDKIDKDLRFAWGESEEVRRVTWPLTLRIGRHATNDGAEAPCPGEIPKSKNQIPSNCQ